MRLSAHPLWLAGFRPFFALAFLSGLSLPVLWVLIFAGQMPAPATSFSMIQWHAHEMFFGFGWAVLGGFLLTSSKNWVNIRGYHGGSLMFLAAAWVFERTGMWYEGVWPPALFWLSGRLFLASIVVMLVWTLARYRRDDTFRDNYFFIIALPLFLPAKYLLLTTDGLQDGWSMTIGLFRLAFLLMLERTLTQFMKNVFQADILRNAILDTTIKTVALLLVFEAWLPPLLAASIAPALAVLLAGRFVFWKPQLAMRRLDIGIMYLGYIAIIAQLLIHAAGRLAYPEWGGSVSVHVFTFGVMGLIIPAMLVRIAKGHTGRKAVFDALDKSVLWIMILGFGFRVIAPQLYPAGYAYWIVLAAGCWFACFSILAWRYVPYLLRPRVDGREH
jgi:uncharacterized protein involved in response to NO